MCNFNCTLTSLYQKRDILTIARAYITGCEEMLILLVFIRAVSRNRSLEYLSTEISTSV